MDRLKQQGRSMDHTLADGNDFSGYWGLGQIMNAADAHPPYSANFLDEVGNDMIAWDQQRQSHGATGPFGPYEGGGPFDQPGSPLRGRRGSPDPALIETGPVTIPGR